MYVMICGMHAQSLSTAPLFDSNPYLRDTHSPGSAKETNWLPAPVGDILRGATLLAKGNGTSILNDILEARLLQLVSRACF